MAEKRTLKEARDEYNSLLEARNNAKKKAQEEGFDKLTAEERTAITAYDDKHLGLVEEIKALTPDLRGFNPNVGVQGNRDWSQGDEKNFAEFRLNKAFLSIHENKALTGIEKEVHEEGRKQAEAKKAEVSGQFVLPDFRELRGQSATGQTSAAGDQGGKTIKTELLDLIEQFWDASVLSRLNATTFTNIQGNLSFPVQTTKPAIQERTEIEELDDTEVLFDQIAMSPKRRGVSIPYSIQFLRQSSISVEAFLRQQILNAFGQKADVEVITALLAAITTGNGNIVLGDTNGAAPTYANVVNIEGKVDVANALTGNSMAYLTNSKVKTTLKLTQKFASTNGMPVWENGNELNSYPAVVSNAVPSNLTKGTSSVCSPIIFGNFSDLYVAQWGPIDFVVNPYSLDKKAQIRVTANTFWDIKVARLASFAGMKDALTTL